MSATGAVCSHSGGSLDEGQPTDTKIQCPWHELQFSITDGSVEVAPATASVPAYDVRIKNDLKAKARNGHNQPALAVLQSPFSVNQVAVTKPGSFRLIFQEQQQF